MPLLRVNATSAGLTLHETPQPILRTLRGMAAQPGPAIIMLHGYKYAPGSDRHCPHRKIFGTGAQGWPERLGFGGGGAQEGLGIALGWTARGSLRRAHARAQDLGQSLAVIVAMLRTHRPRHPVHVIAHSLGVETALTALRHLPEGAVDRMVLLTGASYARRALDLLDTPAGRSVEILNVTSRENDLFDAAFERMIPPARRGDRALGQGIAAPNVANLQLDCAQSLAGLRSLGHQVADPARRICHWSAYRRPGIMGLYSAFLRAPDTLPLDRLKEYLPEKAAPRWSRLLALPDRGGAAGRPGAASLFPGVPTGVPWRRHRDRPTC